MIKKGLKFLLATLLLLFNFSFTPVFAVENENQEISISAISDVSWCGDIGWGYGTYPQRAISSITIKYPEAVADNLSTNSFTVQDMLYQDRGEEASGVDFKNGFLNVDNVIVDENLVTLDISVSSSAGVLTSEDGNFRRLVSEFKVTQVDPVTNLNGDEIAVAGTVYMFDQDDITNVASDEFQDLIVPSENSNNNTYVKYYLPENYSTDRNYPMVVHCTGGGQQYSTATPDENIFGANNFGVELDIDLTPKTFSIDAPEDTIVVTIQALKENQPDNYNAGKDIDQIVEYFINNYSVDTNRVYAIGNSQGGVHMSKAVAYRPDLFTAYLPCNTSIAMNTKTITADDVDDPIYQECLQYCQAYVDNEVGVYFNVGRNDFTGAYEDDVLPYAMLQDLYRQKGYSEEEIADLVKMEVYENEDFHAVGSTYYHGATGLMCLNDSVISWLYQQSKASDVESIVSKVDNYEASDIYVYDASSLKDINTENTVYAPTYVIYPDQSVDEYQASALLNELGIISNIDKYATKAYIVNPVDDTWSTLDDETFLSILDNVVGPNPNIKVIGIGNGATFVNQYVTQKDWAIAGIMTYGGELGQVPKYSVPTYVSQSNDEVVNQYASANNATQLEQGNLTKYINPDNSYELVVTNPNSETLAEAFNHAWENVFSNNGRLGNIGGTFYSMSNSQEREYQYVSFVQIDKLGITRNVIEQDLNGNGQNNLWYEYLPAATIKAEEKTVPVVVLLHGNGNDPRTQFETSGWADVASQEGIILIEPEWQGSTIGGYEYETMTTDDSTSETNDIITMINVLLEKYPQIDPSRIYVEGLSRGGLNSLHLGLTYSNVFAAVASHSAGEREEFYDVIKQYTDKNKMDYDMPMFIALGSVDSNNFVPFYQEGVSESAFKAIQTYQEFNDMKVYQQEDLDSSIPYFGMLLNNFGNIENDGLCNIVGGTMTNDNGAAISMNVVEDWGHWNYEPTAKMMWNFFKQYSRNVETGELIVEGIDSNVPANDDVENSANNMTTSNDKNSHVNTGDDVDIRLSLLGLAGIAVILAVMKKYRKLN